MAPAMNTNMFAHPAVVKNLETLMRARRARSSIPGEGYLACGWIGKGRLAEPADVVAAAEQRAATSRTSAIAGRPQRAGHRRADVRGHRSGALRRQSLERPDGLRAGRRSAAPRRRGDARHRPDAPDRAARRRSGQGAQRRRDARGGDGARGRAGRRGHGRGGGRLHAGRAGAAEGQEERRPADHHAARAPRTSSATSASCRRAQQRRPVLVGFAAETTTWSRTRGRSCSGRASISIVANDVSRSRRRLRVDTNAVTLVIGGRRRGVAAAGEERGRGAHPRSRRAVPDRRAREERPGQGVTHVARAGGSPASTSRRSVSTGVSRDPKWRHAR